MSYKKEPILQVRDLTVFRDAYLILDKVNLELHASDCLYLLGENGSGKSSLIQLLFGLLPFSTGEVLLWGQSLASLSIEEQQQVRRRMAWLSFDNPLLPELSVEENLLLIMQATGWQSPPAKLRLEQLLSECQIGHLALRSANSLNRSECARVLFARSLLNSPELLLVDGIQASLSPEAAASLWELIYSVCKNKQISLLASLPSKLLARQYPGSIYLCKAGSLELVP